MTYYLRAFATNSVGTAYGNQVSFTTLQITLPTVTTSPVTNITATTATSGGNVTDDGGATVTARGVCWSTSQNPTISDFHTIDGSGTGIFVSQMTGLLLVTNYYVRAYATNSVGTAYGDQLSFIISLEIGYSYAGGIIFYLDGMGGGLVCAPTDQSDGEEWGCFGYEIGTDTGIGTGAANTVAIVSGCGQSNIAAETCYYLVLNGYDDWFLPSKDELNLMYFNLHLAGIGSFNSAYYWSSSEYSYNESWGTNFIINGQFLIEDKWHSLAVRAVRAFSY